MEEYLNIALSIEPHYEEYAKLWLIASEYYPAVAKKHEHPLKRHSYLLDYSLEVHGKLTLNEDEDVYISEAMTDKELKEWNSLSDEEKRAQLDMDLDLYQMEKRHIRSLMNES